MTHLERTNPDVTIGYARGDVVLPSGARHHIALAPEAWDALETALAEPEQLRLVLALIGEGADPDGNYAGTPGTRVRELLAAEQERDAMRPVVEAARAFRSAIHDADEDDDWDEEPWPTLIHTIVAAVDALDGAP